MPQYDLLKASAVTAIQSDLEDAVEADRIAAQDARIASETARDQSQASAIASGASIYATTGDGLADTQDGELFYVPESNGLRVYENVAGSAVAGIFLSRPAFTDRATAVSTVGDGDLADGALISAGGLLYEAKEGATDLTDKDRGLL